MTGVQVLQMKDLILFQKEMKNIDEFFENILIFKNNILQNHLTNFNQI